MKKITTPNDPAHYIAVFQETTIRRVWHNEEWFQAMRKLAKAGVIIALVKQCRREVSKLREIIKNMKLVKSHHYNAGYLAAQHFIERGKTKLAFLSLDYFAAAERLRGFRKALLVTDKDLIRFGVAEKIERVLADVREGRA